MKHYYITDPSAEKGFVEVSEEEFRAVVGDETTRPYANKVYRGEMTMDEVPEELREAVQAVVDAKVSRFGLYAERDLNAQEALNIITGGNENEA